MEHQADPKIPQRTTNFCNGTSWPLVFCYCHCVPFRKWNTMREDVIICGSDLPVVETVHYCCWTVVDKLVVGAVENYSDTDRKEVLDWTFFSFFKYLKITFITKCMVYDYKQISIKKNLYWSILDPFFGIFYCMLLRYHIFWICT